MNWMHCTVAAVLLMILAACATLSLPDGAAPAEERAARCLDARAAMAVADAAMQMAPAGGGAEWCYWQAFSLGCRAAINAYCGPQTVCVEPAGSWARRRLL
jgi:hypothetical protein